MTVLIAPLGLALAAAAAPAARPLEGRGGVAGEAVGLPAADQVRIEQRLIIRVAPMGPGSDLLAELPGEPRAARLRERKVGRCLPAAGIAGVEIGEDDRLLLFMRDHRLIAASLEKACSARDFYSGFYVERSRDGQLCVERDMLRSRTGASCSISRLRQLVAAGG